MSTLNPPTNLSKRHELREDKVVTFYARAWEFFDRNRALVYGALAVLVLLVAAIIGYVFYRANQAEEAERLLGQIVPVYESGDYRAALDGGEGMPGLLTIADEYGGSDAGNLAHFYAADALFQLGEYDQALEHFEAFDKDDDFLGASALAGEAAVYEDRGEFAEAGDLYREAALHYENELYSPQYLLSAARAYEEAGQLADARAAYTRIQEDYPDSAPAAQIDLYLARLDAMD